ncbi:MAG: GAF domain-containing sensor histidine kinase [Pedobacter sp.]|nr:GAF domain-containing sensor histidine kinase [Pedobacter sp.]MDQ8053742.1 GAF domain-containing sensor histidine kinase [Pedobacter sp.]
MERLINLSEFDIDYSNLENNFKDLTALAAKIAGTEISLINLIDAFTQWTVSKVGLDVDQMPREDSVCQYTIMGDDHFEITDLSKDNRFQDKDYVGNPLNLRYYFGIPLKTSKGYSLGALCVMDPEKKDLSPDKIDSLKLIANEIMTRLNTIKQLHELRKQLKNANESKKKVAHDIRGPLSGIIGVTQLINEQGDGNNMEELLEMVDLINTSTKSVIDMADEILTDASGTGIGEDDFDLSIFKNKLIKLYGPQALYKEIDLVVNINPAYEKVAIAKDKLLQIVGNLVSNALKFTPEQGTVTVNLELSEQEWGKQLKIQVVDTGCGMGQDAISSILKGKSASSDGTHGEKGYGFGLAIVKNLVELLKGKLEIYSEIGKGSTFEVILKQ